MDNKPLVRVSSSEQLSRKDTFLAKRSQSPRPASPPTTQVKRFTPCTQGHRHLANQARRYHSSVALKAGLRSDEVIPWGRHKAKVDVRKVAERMKDAPDGSLVVGSGIADAIGRGQIHDDHRRLPGSRHSVPGQARRHDHKAAVAGADLRHQGTGPRAAVRGGVVNVPGSRRWRLHERDRVMIDAGSTRPGRQRYSTTRPAILAFITHGRHREFNRSKKITPATTQGDIHHGGGPHDDGRHHCRQ